MGFSVGASEIHSDHSTQAGSKIGMRGAIQGTSCLLPVHTFPFPCLRSNSHVSMPGRATVITKNGIGRARKGSSLAHV